MAETCGTCLYYGRAIGNPAPSRYAHDRCALTGRKVCSLARKCALYLGDRDLVAEQQAQGEKWRSGASLPLAIPE